MGSVPGFWEIYPKHIAFSAAFRYNNKNKKRSAAMTTLYEGTFATVDLTLDVL